MDERCRVVKAQERKRPKGGVHNVLFSRKASSPPLGAPGGSPEASPRPPNHPGEGGEPSGGPPGAPSGGLLAALERRDEVRGENWLAA